MDQISILVSDMHLFQQGSDRFRSTDDENNMGSVRDHNRGGRAQAVHSMESDSVTWIRGSNDDFISCEYCFLLLWMNK